MPREIMQTLAELHATLLSFGLSPEAATGTLLAVAVTIVTFSGKLSGWAAKKTVLLALGGVLLVLRGGWTVATLTGRGMARPWRQKPLSDVGQKVLARLDGPGVTRSGTSIQADGLVIWPDNDEECVWLDGKSIDHLFSRADRKAILARARQCRTTLEQWDRQRERADILAKLTPPTPTPPAQPDDYFTISIDDEPVAPPAAPERRPTLPLPPNPVGETPPQKYVGGPYGTPARAS